MPPTLSKQVFNGTMWYVGMRWAIRLLGVISSAFLARLLMPEDFGLVALVMVIYGFISLFFDFGVNWALIQNKNATNGHFDTAWTVRLIQSLVVAVLLVIFAPWIASFYNDTSLVLICQIIAAATLVRGFENIGTIKLQKELQFSKDFKYNVLPKALSTCTTIALAYYFKSFLALVIGLVFSNVIIVIASYYMVSYRPQLSLGKLGEIWGFSKWILIRSIARFINGQGDILVLSLLTTPIKIGYYRWASELSSMTVTEIQQPFSRALAPSLVQLKGDNDRLLSAYYRALSMMTLVCVPAALGFGAIAEELIPIFLGGGDKWLPVVPIIQGLVFLSMFSSMFGISMSLLTISENVKYTAYANWLQVVFTLVTLYPAYLIWEIEGIAYSRALIGLVMFIIYSALVVKKCSVKTNELAKIVKRPVIAGVLMYILLMNISSYTAIDGWQLLAIKCCIGVLFYTSTVLLLWLISGKEETGEAEIIGYLHHKFF